MEGVGLNNAIYVRVSDICRDGTADGNWLLPISRSQWWDGVKRGVYPAPLKLGPRTTVWRLDDIEYLAERLEGRGRAGDA